MQTCGEPNLSLNLGYSIAVLFIAFLLQAYNYRGM